MKLIEKLERFLGWWLVDGGCLGTALIVVLVLALVATIWDNIQYGR